MARMQLEIKLEIARLLAEGFCISDVARQTHVLPGSVAFQAKMLVMDGRLERTSERPAHYQPANPVSFQVGGSAISSGKPDSMPQTCIFKKFGASFKQVGRPAILYREDGKARIETPGYIIEFGRYKTKIWLKSFVGATLAEQLVNGEATIRALASHYAHKYRITLTFDRLYEEREVLVASVAESAKLAAGVGLGWGEQKAVRGALQKAGDSSDLDNLQINQLPRGNPKRPEEQGSELEKLYGGVYGEKLRLMEERQDRTLALIEKLVQGHEKTGEALTAIRQRLELRK